MSNLTGIPKVVLTVAFSKYFPFTDSGRLRAIASRYAFRFRYKSSSEKSLIPTLFMMYFQGVILNSTRPCLLSFTVCTRASCLTSVPLLTFGISPFGPRILAYCFKLDIYSGVAMILSKSVFPSLMSFSTWSSPIMSAPAYLRSSWNSWPEKTQTLISLPIPAGNMHVPLMF